MTLGSVTVRSAARLAVALVRLLMSIALPLLILSGFLILSSTVTFYGFMIGAGDAESAWWQTLLSIALTIVLSVYCGAGTTRILARIFPLRADGKTRIGVVVGLGVSTVSVQGFLVYGSYLGATDVDGGLGAAMAVVLAILALNFLAVGSYPVAWTIIRHVRGRMQGGALYLRRFAGAGNTPVMRVLLAAAPPGLPVAFITGPSANRTSWNPLIVAFAGFRWLRPWTDIPLFLTSDDRTWMDNVRTWIQRSRIVVLDLSEYSSSVRVEAEVIDELGAADRTLYLIRRTSTDSANARTSDGRQVICYELSWPSAVLQIVTGALVVVIAVLMSVDNLFGVDIPMVVMGAFALLLLPERALTRASRKAIRSAFRAFASAAYSEDVSPEKWADSRLS